MKNIYKKEMIIILSLLAVVVVFIVVQATTGFISCEKKKDLPWYEDFDNLSFTLSDDRSITDDYKWDGKKVPKNIEFVYVMDEYFDMPIEARIDLYPTLKVFYKGEKKYAYVCATDAERLICEGGEERWVESNSIRMEGTSRLSLIAETEKSYRKSEIIGVSVKVIIKRSENHEN